MRLTQIVRERILVGFDHTNMEVLNAMYNFNPSKIYRGNAFMWDLIKGNIEAKGCSLQCHR